jgi:hypothetical protein
MIEGNPFRCQPLLPGSINPSGKQARPPIHLRNWQPFGCEPKSLPLSPIFLGHKSQPARPITTTVRPRIRRDYYVFMTAPVEIGWIAENSQISAICGSFDFSWKTHAFVREPNALPKLCNLLKPKSFGSPGRIRTSNISVNSRGVQKSKCLVWCRLPGKMLIFSPSVGLPELVSQRSRRN